MFNKRLKYPSKGRASNSVPSTLKLQKSQIHGKGIFAAVKIDVSQNGQFVSDICRFARAHTHTHTHTHGLCRGPVCVCMCAGILVVWGKLRVCGGGGGSTSKVVDGQCKAGFTRSSCLHTRKFC